MGGGSAAKKLGGDGRFRQKVRGLEPEEKPRGLEGTGAHSLVRGVRLATQARVYGIAELSNEFRRWPSVPFGPTRLPSVMWAFLRNVSPTLPGY
jgi:hypothetical protein